MTTVVFLGVTTGSSLVHQAISAWQSILATQCNIRGADISLDADDDTYIRFLDGLTKDESAAGAVITTHKVRLFRAGRDLFAGLDPFALACGEINAIRRTTAGLSGFARDPVSVGRLVDRIWPESDGEVVCLGTGGAARALAQHLFATRRPVRFVCADPIRVSVEQLARVAGHPVSGHVGNRPWDDLVEDAPPGSLIVNATGLGKDRPGSPITGRTRFPPGAVVWELNYRGELAFLAQARAQAENRGLQVHDGWELFCHGWAAALSAVLDLADDDKLGDRFAKAAQSLRPKITWATMVNPPT
ncbi:MAG: shikimate dehydrogenase family protein [Acidimicrobiales bacterium]